MDELRGLIFALFAVLKKNSGGSGTTNYAALTNKPKINGVTLSGDNEFEDLGMRPLSKAELKAMWDD